MADKKLDNDKEISHKGIPMTEEELKDYNNVFKSLEHIELKGESLKSQPQDIFDM